MDTSPTILFVYDRPDHTRQTLEALADNDLAARTMLYVYADGPKPFASDHQLRRLADVRAVVRSRPWCGEVHLVESDWNRGLAGNIVRGVTEIIHRHGRVIVLEDDIVTRPGFLRYMNDALDLYVDDSRVMHVSGMIFGTPRTSGPPTAFLRVMSCHGWATWKRAWNHYSHDPEVLLQRLRAQGVTPRKFDIEGHASFYRQLLKNCDGRLNTWAVKWYASWLTAGGYSLFPRRSLLTNIGHDGSGVHSTASFFNGETVDRVLVERIPVVEDEELRRDVDRIWRDGLRPARPLQRPSVRRVVSRSLEPVRRIGRRFLRFCYPELAMLDRGTPHFVITPNSSRNSHISDKARVNSPFHVRDSQVGDYTYVARNAWVSLTCIGKFCSIGPNLTCGWGCHPTDGVSTSPMFYSTLKQNGVSLGSFDKVQERKPIEVGNDVFIGMNVTILDGVTIGDGAVIGAGCVVSKDVSPYAVVVGNPMRVLRYRFTPEIQERLCAIRWWDFPEDKLCLIEQQFFQIEEFLQHCEETVLDAGQGQRAACDG